MGRISTSPRHVIEKNGMGLLSLGELGGGSSVLQSSVLLDVLRR